MSVDVRSKQIGTVVFPPNKPLEVELEFSKKPHVYDYLFYLDFNKNGECILGASNVAGTFWEGSVLYYKNDKNLDNFEYNGYYIYATTSDGKFLNENTIVVAEDTGVLTVLKLDTDNAPIQAVNYFKSAHRISQIAVWDNSKNVLACNSNTINIYNVDNLQRTPEAKFENYHLSTINSVDTIKSDPNLFVTAATDRISCIWDLRLQTPASVLYSNEFSSLTAITANPKNPDYFAVGSQAGSVYLIDKRMPNDFVQVLQCFDNSVYRLCFNDLNQFAACGDTNDVLVISCEKNQLKTIYSNGDHKDYVRGLKWHGETLYSCGFGKCVKKHVK